MLSLLLASTAVAAIQPEQPDAQQDAEPIIITGHLIEGLDLLAGASVLESDDLVRDLDTQIGDTLASLPGVSSTSFAPGASRPVLRGFQGERIRVLNDGLGSIDVANTSADHAVTIDPLTAERIEVLRGPAVLIYGSQAIGGAVNVIDRRIPRTIPDDAVHVDVIGGYSSADDGIRLGASGDVLLADRFVIHADFSWAETDDVKVGGFVFADPLRAELLEEAAEEFEEGEFEEAAELEELAILRGSIPNSGTEQWTGSIGAAYIGKVVEVGASYSIYDTFYGVPLRPGAGHHGEEGEGEEEGEEEEETVSIDMRQERFDGRVKLNLDGFFESATLRFATADYDHVELEGDEVGTTFLSSGVEGRLEFKQRDTDGWHGASGIQYYQRDLEAIGAEAFVPPNGTSQWGIFTVQEYQPDALGIEGALRVEFTDVEEPTLALQRDFTAFSAAIGLNYELDLDTSIGINASRAERAPSAEELYSNGPHIATQAFEVGDADLTTEKAWGGEVFVRHKGERLAASATVWKQWFDDFIYLQDTGLEEDELPLFVYRQQGANYWGIEIEAGATLVDDGAFQLRGDVVADYVRATLDDGSPVPRIPAFRIGGGLEADIDDFVVRGEVEFVAEQDRVAAFETPTDGYALVGASVGWRPFGEDNESLILLQANNIFDVDARRHASYTKDFAPLAGRDIRLSARFSF
ncbi:TonB-dependent receptor [Sphingomicrobium marinum]|uniref:TonB-dependent receptor n=1 Tax=Sphingomicrobium marinum TaxID=1227950 RepID=UPI00224041DB|nr:TonB-dependent receptor [Sphingomicrobium marinum]